MLLTIPDLLSPEQVEEIRRKLDSADWVDGRVTAGHQSTLAKNNMQVPEGHPVAKEVGELILQTLGQNPLFVSAALPVKVFPPLFNRYSGGQSFGTHIDNAIRHLKGTTHRVRSDLSATLFFSNPEEYDGGELVVEDTYGIHSVKLPPGHMVLYPSSSLHNVRPVTRGARVSSFFWIQSMVRDDGARTLLFDLDNVTQRITAEQIDSPNAIRLTGIYHNLLRRWAEV
ncbi:MAG: Fe2+-dependent dioxygenase [Acidobacteriaceae bacterium]|jgi:PKHD-type hydroxylase